MKKGKDSIGTVAVYTGIRHGIATKIKKYKFILIEFFTITYQGIHICTLISKYLTENEEHTEETASKTWKMYNS